MTQNLVSVDRRLVGPATELRDNQLVPLRDKSARQEALNDLNAGHDAYGATPEQLRQPEPVILSYLGLEDVIRARELRELAEPLARPFTPSKG
jgi:hypothetical protein